MIKVFSWDYRLNWKKFEKLIKAIEKGRDLKEWVNPESIEGLTGLEVRCTQRRQKNYKYFTECDKPWSEGRHTEQQINNNRVELITDSAVKILLNHSIKPLNQKSLVLSKQEEKGREE